MEEDRTKKHNLTHSQTLPTDFKKKKKKKLSKRPFYHLRVYHIQIITCGFYQVFSTQGSLSGFCFPIIIKYCPKIIKNVYLLWKHFLALLSKDHYFISKEIDSMSRKRKSWTLWGIRWDLYSWVTALMCRWKSVTKTGE
jgi:hypothetical protein